MGWKEKAEEYWKSLGDDLKKKRWLGGHVTWDADDIDQMTREQIEQTFPNRPRKDGTVLPGVDDAQLTRTLIWQSWNKIRSSEMPPINGNLRSYWYREYEPLYVRLGTLTHHWEEPKEPTEAALLHELPPPDQWMELMERAAGRTELLEAHEQRAVEWLSSPKGRQSYLLNLMTHCFDEFVVHKIFHFQDEFAFDDPRKGFRRVGKLRARLLLATEKEGLKDLVEGFSKSNGISFMASHGEPHLISMAYLADDLEKVGVAHVIIGALTDYDPWGYIIAENFAKKLQTFGFTTELTHLTRIELFTPAQIAKGKRDFSDLSPAKKTQAEKWFKKTKGIHGERAGIHVDLADPAALEKAVKKWLDEVGKGKH